MILTVTPNPSIDYLFEAETLCWDDANRVEMPRKRAGGQGINLTRAARELGGESVAIGLFGGVSGAELKGMLQSEDTPVIDVAIEGDTRVFFGVRETSSGRSMLVNPRGPVLTAEISEQLLDVVRRALVEPVVRMLADRAVQGHASGWRTLRAAHDGVMRTQLRREVRRCETAGAGLRLGTVGRVAPP